MRVARSAACSILAAVVVIGSPARRAAAFSVQEEGDLGRRFALAAREQLPLIMDPEVTGYVARLGREIVAKIDAPFFDYHFFVIRDPSVNAFAVPGGYVYVHAGLLLRASNDDEIAGVLSHEIAHVNAHHLARQQEATQLMNYATLLGMALAAVQPAIGAAAIAANQTVQLRYQREFEQEADYLGVRYLQAVGRDPHGLLDFFKKLADEQRLQPNVVPPYLLSHPVTDERLNHLEAVLGTQQWVAHPHAPASFALQRVQALTRAQTQQPTDALMMYHQMVEANPKDAMARYLYGVTALEVGQLDAAEASLQLARAGGVTGADRELGRIALRLRQPEVALPLLKQAVEVDPDDAGAFLELAKALEALGRADEALIAYRRAVALAPDLDAAQYGLGLLAGRGGNEADGFFHLATALRLRGEYQTALNQYVRARESLPANDPRAEESRQTIKELSEYLKVSVPEQKGK